MSRFFFFFWGGAEGRILEGLKKHVWGGFFEIMCGESFINGTSHPLTLRYASCVSLWYSFGGFARAHSGNGSNGKKTLGAIPLI